MQRDQILWNILQQPGRGLTPLAAQELTYRGMTQKDQADLAFKREALAAEQQQAQQAQALKALEIGLRAQDNQNQLGIQQQGLDIQAGAIDADRETQLQKLLFSQQQSGYKQQQDAYKNQIEAIKMEDEMKNNEVSRQKTAQETANLGIDAESKMADVNDKALERGKRQLLREAIAEGPDTYMNTLKHIDYKEYIKLSKDQADIHQSLLNQKGKEVDIYASLQNLDDSKRKSTLESYQGLAYLMKQIDNLPDHNKKTRDKFYQESLPIIKEIYPNAPDKYNPVFTKAIMLAGHKTLLESRKLEEELKKSGLDNTKTQQMMPLEMEQQELANQRLSNEAQLGGVDKKGLTSIRKNIEDLKTFDVVNQEVINALNKVPDMLRGPQVGKIAPFLNADAQAAKSAAADMALRSRVLLTMPGSLSDKDIEFLQSMVANPKMDPSAAQAAYERIDRISKSVQVQKYQALQDVGQLNPREKEDFTRIKQESSYYDLAEQYSKKYGKKITAQEIAAEINRIQSGK